MKDTLPIADYTYDLPEDRIAFHPLDQRDQSRLLVFRKGQISHARFSQITDYLDVTSTLFFNDTKVVPARLRFRKGSGAWIEILLLSPHAPALTYASMSATGSCKWKCLIGNQKRWKSGTALQHNIESIRLTASLVDTVNGIVEFNWSPASTTFAEVLRAAGDTPLPPYIRREATPEDIARYQTVYAHHRGAVAAPTAGLHFTEEVLASLHKKGINSDFITLHVSAGTFLPVKHDNALEHNMHEEQVVITRQNIMNLVSSKQIVAIGTTTLRALESLYWYGCKLAVDKDASFEIGQDDPYIIKSDLTLTQSLQLILSKMGTDDVLHGGTSIFITPGYDFKVCDGLVTNFHQPGSTLILLVAAFTGHEWKTIYDQAIQHGYRFLSYGDSSLLFRSKSL